MYDGRGQGLKALRDHVADSGIGYAVLHDARGRMRGIRGMFCYPHAYVLDARGKIVVDTHFGGKRGESVHDGLARALAEVPPREPVERYGKSDSPADRDWREVDRRLGVSGTLEGESYRAAVPIRIRDVAGDRAWLAFDRQDGSWVARLGWSGSRTGRTRVRESLEGVLAKTRIRDPRSWSEPRPLESRAVFVSLGGTGATPDRVRLRMLLPGDPETVAAAIGTAFGIEGPLLPGSTDSVEGFVVETNLARVEDAEVAGRLFARGAERAPVRLLEGFTSPVEPGFRACPRTASKLEARDIPVNLKDDEPGIRLWSGAKGAHFYLERRRVIRGPFRARGR